MQDEILKNTFANDAFANDAFERMETTACKSLITMAEAAGGTASVPALTQPPNEGVATAQFATAQFIGARIAPTTLRCMQLTSAGETAGV